MPHQNLKGTVPHISRLAPRRLAGRPRNLKGTVPFRVGGVRGVDMPVHLPTGDWVCGCVGHYADSIERYFGSRPETTSIEDFIALYERLDLGGVLLGWDAQGKALDNAEIARICEQSGGRFVGFGSVDPNREDAVERLARFPGLGLRGLKLHPTLQGFDP